MPLLPPPSDGFNSLSLMHTFDQSTCRWQPEDALKQGPANIFYKMVDSKYFSTARPTHSTLPLQTICK